MDVGLLTWDYGYGIMDMKYLKTVGVMDLLI